MPHWSVVKQRASMPLLRAMMRRRDGSSSVDYGCAFAFPPKLAQGLNIAADEQLFQVEILGAGSGLHWEDLDADLSVPDLLAGLFGTRAF